MIGVLKKNKIYLTVLLYLILKFFTLSSYETVWWDSAVYIGMGKYIYSLGDSGLWEPSRPLVWPIILGFFWKTGLTTSAARMLEILFGSFAIFLAYLIGKEIFDEKTALLSSLFLAISPTYFFYSGIMLTETISTFFSLAAIYLLIKNRHLDSGLLFGIAFMTRFLQIFAFIGIILAFIYYKKNIKPFQQIFFGLAIIVLPYLILNQILYGNAFFPFFQQFLLTNNSGWHNHQPISYYFIELFKENFLYLLLTVGIALTFKKPNSRLISFPFIILFLFFNLIKQKEIRFLIMLLPYMYLLMSYSIVNFMKFKKMKLIAIIFIFFMLVSSMVRISAALVSESEKTNQYAALQNKLEQAKGNIWISSPVMAVNSDKRIEKLAYYPYFSQNPNALIKESENADFVLIDICDLECNPFDSKCEKSRRELILYFQQEFETAYSSKINNCEQFAFQKQRNRRFNVA